MLEGNDIDHFGNRNGLTIAESGKFDETGMLALKESTANDPIFINPPQLSEIQEADGEDAEQSIL